MPRKAKSPQDRAVELLEAIDLNRRRNKLRELSGSVMTDEEFAQCQRGERTPDGRPYPWQFRFMSAGRDNPERALTAANRTGKTDTEARESSYHATGMYPPWWEGRVFTEPVEIWCGAATNESSRDIQQKSLLGTLDENKHFSGTGWIPYDNIIQPASFRQCGVGGVVDTVKVKHSSGGVSEITFKSYEQGREKWQGTSKHMIWLDEEPDYDIYTESTTRLIDKNGLMVFTATPLLGMSDVVAHFLEGGDGIYNQNATWDDAPHLGKEEKARQIASYPAHERDARTKGIPMMGEGAVYPVPDEDIACDPFRIPDYFARIAGIDFGISHPTGVCWLAHDRDSDIVYIYDAYQRSGEAVPYHADAIKDRGDWIPVAWPHDGLQRDKGTAEPLKKQYAARGVNMLHESARWSAKKGGSQSKESAASEVLDRMMTGRFKVFSNLNIWFEQKRMYHRKDGVIQPVRDDVLRAGDYALMMLRYAVPSRRPKVYTTCAEYNPMAVYESAYA